MLFNQTLSDLNISKEWKSKDVNFYQKIVRLIDKLSIKTDSSVDSLPAKILNDISLAYSDSLEEAVHQLSFILWLNENIRNALRLMDMNEVNNLNYFCRMIEKYRRIILKDIQIQYFRTIIEKSAHPSLKNSPKLKIDRTLSFIHPSIFHADSTLIEQGYAPDILHSVRNSIFGQLMSQLKHIPSSQLRTPKPKGSSPHQAFLVKFQGEQVLGQAGPYRALFSSVTRELVHVLDHKNYPLALFIPTANNIHKVGEGRHLVYVNTSWTTSQVR
jgi:hypothetical protein